jgi:hypothetical protein
VLLLASVLLNLELAIFRELLDNNVEKFISTLLILILLLTTKAFSVGNYYTL